MKNIHINQLGYRPNDTKKAVVPKECTEYTILNKYDNSVAFTGTASEPVQDEASKETVRIIDFTKLTEKGEFVITTGDEKSFPFRIQDHPYKNVRCAVLEMFNYQKCGVDLHCGLWSHPACHTSPATIYGTKEKKEVSGGWHDAGDYGRYIVPAAKSVADLLLAHEFSPNKDNELLDIVWFEIEWMLKMQDAKTGGVYHKVSCKRFDSLDEMPHDEKEELIISPISATATADFAATMALASRFYQDKKEILIKAARHAWNWCVKNPELPGFTNPEDIHTGGYGDDYSYDERLWAACELLSVTNDKTEAESLKNFINKEINTDHVYSPSPWFPIERRMLSGLGWANMGTYAVLAYLSCTKEKTGDEITQRFKNELLSDCENIMTQYAKCPYGISLGEFFAWGSNMTVANNAMMLILGSRFTDDEEKKSQYTEAAYEHFHYLLGKNPLSQSYITGFGSNPAKFPHHRPSCAKGSAVPGMVVGGPVAKFDRDPAINTYCKDAPPSMRYIDHIESFSSNEITIYWNSPAYFVMAALGM